MLSIVAQGGGYQARGLAFKGENDPRWMDMTIAYFTIPRTSGDDLMWRWYNAPCKRSVSLRPDRHGTTRAMLSISKAPEGEQDWDVDRQKAFLRNRFADAGQETPRILAAMDTTDDFYFDVLRQVRMPRWSSGHVVLTGDAAWCATPLAGIGATLAVGAAVTGAYVLAEQLVRGDSVEVALEAYETQMRPMVENGQGVPKITPRLMHPKSRLGISLLHGSLASPARTWCAIWPRSCSAIPAPRSIFRATREPKVLEMPFVRARAASGARSSVERPRLVESRIGRNVNC